MCQHCAVVLLSKLAVPGGLLVAALVLFSVNLEHPATLNFDEFHYVPAARAMLDRQAILNPEHPPLAKTLIAAGIAVIGDRPAGWRAMSVLFGGLTLVGMYCWGLALFERRESALTVALLTLFNGLLYVQARIAMLDTFMFAFLSFAMAGLAAAWRPDQAPTTIRNLLLVSGALLGLATACKWAAVVPWAMMGGLVVAAKSGSPGFPSGPWRNVSWKTIVLSFGLVPLLCYYLPFSVYFAFDPAQRPSVWDIVYPMQRAIWDGQMRVGGSHPYMSRWWEWATLQRPIWYAFSREGEWVRGVLMIGNPGLMWGGLGAVAFSAWAWRAHRSRAAFLIVTSYLVFYLGWILIPRNIAFYYYYYPAGMTLSLAGTFALDWIERYYEGRRDPAYATLRRGTWIRWAAVAGCLALFLFFLPILGAFPIPGNRLHLWMWFDRWV
jgi:dolichyl-phosphate-mannose-protein mannosyltransferase